MSTSETKPKVSRLSMEDLQKFCSTDETRIKTIGYPWRFGVHTYATDARVLIRVPFLRASASNNFAPTAWKLFTTFPDFDGVKLPELGERQIIDCPDCNGTGTEEDGDSFAECDCGRCDGEGTVEKLMRVKIGAFDYDLRFLKLMETLPNVLVNPTDDFRVPMAFKFDGGGEGFLHGLKPEGIKIAKEDE